MPLILRIFFFWSFRDIRLVRVIRVLIFLVKG